jgi:flagellar hook-basal body complex protein FliE
MKIGSLDTVQQLKMLKPIEHVDTPKPSEKPAKGGKTFSDFLVNSVAEVNNLSLDADQKIRDTVAGKDVEPHSTLIALQKADISFRLMMQVKQRVEQAYQQIIRTQM